LTFKLGSYFVFLDNVDVLISVIFHWTCYIPAYLWQF